MSQQPHANKLDENLTREDEMRIINGVFKPHGMRYVIEDKEDCFPSFEREIC